MAAANHSGCVHHPTDHDLIALVLRPMASAAAAAGQHHGLDGLAGGGFVHLADVYSVAPERLAERYAPTGTCWYFVCPARRRYRPAAAAGALGERCWASEAVRPITGPDGRRVGQSRVLSYGAGTAAPWAAVTRRGWCMVDDDQDGGGGGAGAGAGDFVLCKLFRSSSATAVAVAMAVPAFVSSCKRKAAVEEHPEAPPSVRQQLMQRSF
ncbi:hypothetical protein HU200_048359 [Digitaria exilis]|uniref:NAC domain-containing protein n=1 Tax=Digitaria exilis TaxID=1010633 RepID=A0A835B0Y8_9POAL|nr:hypothetical protein HU200_048359 [Digitaria exilis]